MPRNPQRPLKAYKDPNFLQSPDARLVRMLAEYLEPQRRFRREKVRDTIVFFGSARLRSSEAVKAEADALRKEKGGARGHRARLRQLDAELNMCRYYDDAVELARLLTRWAKRRPESARRLVICSGGAGGIMEAANRGAHEAGGPSIGLNISLPFEQLPNPYVTPGLSFEFHYFFMRKFWFFYPARALVVFPGGFGTFDELFEMLTLTQTGKSKKRKLPIIIYGAEYWSKVLNFHAMIRAGTISKDDLKLVHFSDSPAEAFNYLKRRLTT